MLCLFDLPCDYLTYLLTELFSLEDIAFLDTALTNNHQRPQLLTILSREENVFSGNFSHIQTPQQTRWLLMRRMKVKFLPIFGYNTVEVQQLFRLNHKTLEKIFTDKLLKKYLFDTDYYKQDIQVLLPVNLNSIHLSNCELFFELFVCIGGLCPKLSYLSIVECSLQLPTFDIAISLPALKHLCIQRMYSTKFLINMVQATTQLETFLARDCVGYVEIMKELSQRCNHLKKLSIPDKIDCDVSDIVQLINNCPMLKECTIGEIEQDYNPIIHSLMSVASQMTVLSLDSILEEMDQALVVNFIRNTTLLVELRLELDSITDERLYDEVFVAVADCCPLIEILWLKYSDCSSDSILKVIDKCRCLKTLDICSCTAVNDTTMCYIATNLKQLNVLGICVEHLTQISFDILRNNFDKLWSLTLCHGEVEFDANIERKWIPRLKVHRPHLSIKIEI